MTRVLTLALSFFFSTALFAATFTVNDLGDAPDAAAGNGACATAGAVCTLRAAIQEANALAGADVVQFSVAGTISPATELPAVVQQLTIDGTTAPGYTTAPVVVIDGAFSLATGLNFTGLSANSIVRGLQVYGFSSAGVSVSANDIGIYNNYLGPVGGGTANQDGLALFASRTLVGGNDGASGNVISGNQRFGILAAGSGHEIADNHIGTDAAGTAAVPNGDDGVRIFSGANAVTVGGLAPGTHNVISGNGGDGIEIANASSNTISANFIGLDATGSAALPNGGAGVRLTNGAGGFNSVGSVATRTYISGNTLAGVWIQSGAGNTVRNSTIGLATDGVTAIPNSVGVLIESGTGVGSVVESVVSGNTGDGIAVANATSSVIESSLIGTDDAGGTAVPNGGHGISVGPGSFVRIGSTAGAGNRIAGNTLDGIRGTGASQLQVYANVIGLADGDAALPNGGDGIHLVNATSSIIGNATNGRNTISANVNGIRIDGGTNNNVVGNRIGTDTLGTADRGNTQHGIWITNATNLDVTDNLISGNGAAGLRVDGSTNDLLANSNIIGLAAGLAAALPNATGIVVAGTANSNTLGTITFPNVIAGNLDDGIAVIESAQSNYIESSIYNNGGLGIDLADDGVTLNDPLDPDAGANTRQNFPVITSATTSATETRITGTLNTTPGTHTLVHFYSSPAADPSGYGEGLTILGRMNVLTDPAGNASFTFTGPPTTVGQVATATATPSTGSSEFSQAVAIAPPPQFSFSATTYATGEGALAASITVIRTGDTSATQTIDYATSDNTATAGSDYTAASGTLTFNPGVAALAFNIPILDDTTDEPNELINLTLSNPTNGATLGTSSATLEIGDDDAPPAITIGDHSLAEGDGGATNFVFNVTIPVASSFPITVDYTTANGTATAGSDFTATAGIATIPAGSTGTTITVPVTGEVLFETDETFTVVLTNPANATISDAQGTGTILNDDAAPSIAVNDLPLNEGDAGTTPFAFTVTLSNPSATAITVDYTTVNGTATAGSDFTAASGTVTFTPGMTSAPIAVNVTGDTLSEPDETFTIALTNPTGGATILDAEGLGTIVNDDGVPTILIGDLEQSEGNGGATLFTFTVTLSEPSASPVTVDFATADGTATAGADYTAASGTLTFLPGDTSETITVTVAGDTLAEGTETFTVNLTNATNAAIADAQATGTITNDDAALAEQPIPTLSEWSLLILGAMLAALAIAKMR